MIHGESLAGRAGRRVIVKNFLLVMGLAAGCSSAPQGFMIQPPTADEIQVVSPEIMVAPGANITMCSYVSVPIASQIDVIGSNGKQSLGGHHAIVYIARMAKPIDTHECTEQDMLNVSYLAGVGAEGATALSKVPDGIAFRIPANAPLMIQTHWINATNAPITGQAYINLQTTPVSTARVPADLFSVVNTSFDIPAGMTGTASTTCVLKEDKSFFYLGGHEHQWGTHFKAEQVSAAGAATTLYEKDWQVEFEFNPPVNTYPAATPLTIKAGDAIKATCTWDNTGNAKDLTFPTDMCVTFGFYFPGHGEIDCVDGQWPM
jgi:hypothetical protein